MSKILWVDTETTGTDPTRHGLIQVAMIAVVDSCVAGEFSMVADPFAADVVDSEALAVRGLTADDLMTGTPPFELHNEIKRFLGRYVDKYDRADKFVPAGYNVVFDVRFLRAFFTKCHDKYFGSWVMPYTLDLLPVVRFLSVSGLLDVPDCKLSTICAKFGVALDEAHDAMSDIKATMSLYETLLEHIPGGAFEV